MKKPFLPNLKVIPTTQHPNVQTGKRFLLCADFGDRWFCRQVFGSFNFVQSPISNLEQLTEWAVESRYPSDLPDPSVQDSQDALQQAEFILVVVKQDLNQQGFVC